MGIYTQAVQQLYVAYFNRPADKAGLQYWESVVAANGGSTTAVSAAFSASAEYTALFAGMSSTQVVNKVYHNLFGRPAEPTGLLYWALLLDQGKISVSNVVTQVAGGAQTTDLVAYQSKVTAATSFTDALDTTAEITGYKGPDALALAKAYIAGVTDATTLAAAIAPAALDATVKNVTDTGNQVAGQTFSLTSGIDTVVGTVGNDTINSPSTSVGLTALDNVDGGAGTDTLNVTDTAAVSIPASATVKNVETANITSGSTVSADVSGWTGLTKVTAAGVAGVAITAATTTAVTVSDAAKAAGVTTVTGGSTVAVTATGSTTGAITVSGAAGAVTVSNTSAGAVSMGAISVAGGTTISVTQANTNAVNTTAVMGTVAVTGTSATTAVTVSNAKAAVAAAAVVGVTDNTVSITDVNSGSATKAGTITSVSISGYTTAAINDNALTTLSLTNGSGNVIINNGGLATATNKTLAVTANGLTGGTLDDADIYTTLNVTTATANSTLANVTFGAATALTVAGTKTLTLASTAGLTALKTVTVTDAAGVTADLSGATVTAIDTSASTGESTITLDATKATYTGGAGVDFVTTSAVAPTKAISLGAGADKLTLASGTTAVTGAIDGGADTDTLSMVTADAATASLTATFAGKVTGFEHLTLTAPGTATVAADVLGNYNYITTAGATALTVTGLTTGATLELTAAGTAYDVSLGGAAVLGTTDAMNIVTSNGTGVAIAFGSVTASYAETVAITTADTQATATNVTDTLTVVDANAKTVTVSGTDGLALTFAGTAATTVDASGISAGDFTWASGGLTAAAAVKGSATGTNTVDFSLATKVVTYTGGSGDDVLTLSTQKNIVTLGDGANLVSGTSGDQTITGGANADSVTLTTGNNVVSLGNGANAFTATSGSNTYTGGTGVDTVTVGGGVNTITTGTGADIVTFTAVTVSGNTYSTVTDAHVGEKIVFTDAGQVSGTSTFVAANAGTLLNAGTAVFQDYLDAAAASAGAATNSVVSWFTFGGNTYVVEDNSAAVTFQNGVDSVVKLTGIFDLSTATFAAVATASTALTLA